MNPCDPPFPHHVCLLEPLAPIPELWTRQPCSDFAIFRNPSFASARSWHCHILKMSSFQTLLALFLFIIPGEYSRAAETRIAVGTNDKPPEENFDKPIPYDTIETNFLVTPLLGLTRYRLAGWDSNWIDRRGEMFFLVRFRNAKGDQIAQQSFMVKGRSRGWGGTEENSIATDRSEKVVVPPDADNFTIAISSAGPAVSIGTFAITALNVSTIGSHRELIGKSTATAWSKGGTRPSMASERTDRNGELIHVLMDDDTTGHADWMTVSNAASRVTPGETLQLRWQEYFCTGMGDPFTVKYTHLPPGSYRFEVESLGFSGEAPGTLMTLPIRVAQPFWKDLRYWAAAALLAAAGFTLLGRHLVRKRIQLHLREAQMIGDERLRIARDLHDNLGARLSHISLLGAHSMSSAPDAPTQEKFQQITSMSRELVTALSETVWMLNSKNDHLESLVDYLCRMVSELCRSLDIRCRIDAISPAEDQPVSSEVRHHVTMVVKEAVNNALKHSKCTEIRLKIDLHPSGLDIGITDNGIGLDEAGNEQGNGLENIRQRMDDLGGRLSIGKSEEGGVSILLHVPL